MIKNIKTSFLNNFYWGLLNTVFFITIISLVTVWAQNDKEEGGLLKQRCTICHGLERIEAAQNNFKQEDWEETIGEMVKKGAQLNGQEQTALIEYLLNKDE